MYFLITYDIEESKKRTKLAAMLEKYGVRVNYSVFELDLEKRVLDTLLGEVKKLTGERDSVRVYRFSRDTIAHSFELLDRPDPFEKESGYVD
jgi:CRISPR-associated protein Cas2